MYMVLSYFIVMYTVFKIFHRELHGIQNCVKFDCRRTSSCCCRRRKMWVKSLTRTNPSLSWQRSWTVSIYLKMQKWALRAHRLVRGTLLKHLIDLALLTHTPLAWLLWQIWNNALFNWKSRVSQNGLAILGRIRKVCLREFPEIYVISLCKWVMS